MGSPSPERSRGDDWAAWLRERGCWVQKMPASAMAGVPDWIVGKLNDEVGEPRWVEAKAALKGKNVYRPKQVDGAQRFFLDRWVQSGGRASLLILAEDGWAEIEWSEEISRNPLTRVEFDVMKRSY